MRVKNRSCPFIECGPYDLVISVVVGIRKYKFRQRSVDVESCNPLVLRVGSCSFARNKIVLIMM